jgi:hypothetical protein
VAFLTHRAAQRLDDRLSQLHEPATILRLIGEVASLIRGDQHKRSGIVTL